MPTNTGIWSPEEAATGHVFDYKLAQWMGQYFPKNVPLIDMGCGPATYLRYFHDIGFENLRGVEGSKLNFEFGNVLVRDLSYKFDLELQGNVVCIEVMEHIPAEIMDPTLKNITKHIGGNGRLFMSWAIPGQDGLGHCNCQHNIWVIEKMKEYRLRLNVADSLKARAMVSDYAHWLRDTIMIFEW